MSSPTTAPSQEGLYTPLADSNEIRLLYLQPRASSNIITCVTKHVKLSEKPQYEALSYEWGPKDTEQISFNGRVYDIRRNLCDALLHLRHETDERVMWIDALCINQTDVQERNHQVTQMGSIYKDATGVVVWLGVVDEACLKALQVLQSTEEFPARKDIFSSHSRRPDFLPVLERKDPVLEKEQALVMESFLALSQRSYWTRLWIVQELFLALRLHIQCGEYSLPWDRLKDFVFSKQARGTVHTRDTAERLNRSLMARFCIFCPRGIPHPINKSTLYSLCIRYGDSKCENVLDRVYGLSALAHECCRNAVLIDYGLTIDEVLGQVISHSYTHFARWTRQVDVGTLKYIVKGSNDPPQPYLKRLQSFLGL